MGMVRMEDSSGRESMMREYCNRELRKWMTLVIQHQEKFQRLVEYRNSIKEGIQNDRLLSYRMQIKEDFSNS